MHFLVACLIWPVTAMRMWPHCVCWLWHCRHLWNSLCWPIVRGHCPSQPAIVTNLSVWSELPLSLSLLLLWMCSPTASTFRESIQRICRLWVAWLSPIGLDWSPFVVAWSTCSLSIVILFVLFFFDSFLLGGSTDYTYLIIQLTLDSFKHCFITSLFQIFNDLAYIKRSVLSFRSKEKKQTNKNLRNKHLA